jgi:hypothetical protein
MKIKLKDIMAIKEEFENSFEVDAEAEESEWENAEPENKKNWEKELSLGNVFSSGKKKEKKNKKDKKEEKKPKPVLSFLVVKDVKKSK